jgi:hypothetical protein
MLDGLLALAVLVIPEEFRSSAQEILLDAKGLLIGANKDDDEYGVRVPI